jgi:hypothetical protein
MTGGPDQPGRDRCGARHHHGSGTCQLPAGWGTGHPGTGRCRKHLGNAPNHVIHAAEQGAREAAEKFGLPITTTATRALQEELARANGIVQWLTARCQELAGDDGLVWGTERRVMKTGPGQGAQAGTPQVEVTLAARLHPYAAWLERAQRHLAAVASEMSRLSIEDRAVRVTEAEADLVARILELALHDAGLDQGQQVRVKGALSKRFGELELVRDAPA